MIELALQIVLVVLLLLTITWCVIVHRRLHRLRGDRDEMQAFILALSEATGRAEAAVQQMREANQQAASARQEQERRARQHGQELARLMENALRVMKRLDAAVEQGATRVAEARTREVLATRPALEEAASPAPERPVERRAIRKLSAADLHGGRTVQREGKLGSLLHGELLQALEGLR